MTATVGDADSSAGDDRPSVSAKVAAEIILAAPDRVRRRLDRTPAKALEWNWSRSATGWTVDTGSEQVTLPLTQVTALDHVSCTCLLSPNCFHLLACVSSLPTVEAHEEANYEDVDDSQDESQETHTAVRDEEGDAGRVRPASDQLAAAAMMSACLRQVLAVGVANAGVVLQAGLLRAIHGCRTHGLYRAASLGARVLTGLRQVRKRSLDAEPSRLAWDFAELLETIYWISEKENVREFWLGTARRKYYPVRPRRLHGLFAEPIWTRSGYAGAVVYFLGADDQIYSVADVKPGSEQNVRDAYLGGIEIGSLVQPAERMARGRFLGSDMTGSLDGRLGRGQRVSVIQQGNSSWCEDSVRKRFETPLDTQLQKLFANFELPEDARRAGWDFVFLRGRVLGACGPELLWQPDGVDCQPVRLAIANDHAMMTYRENLQLLSFAAGLPLLVIGRWDTSAAFRMYPLAVAPVAQLAAEATETPDPEDVSIQFELPNAWSDRVCLGFDSLQRKHLRGLPLQPTQFEDASVAANGSAPDTVDPSEMLSGLERRWVALLLAGAGTQKTSDRNSVQREIRQLQSGGLETGACLLAELTASNSATVSTHYLATAVYLRRCKSVLSR